MDKVQRETETARIRAIQPYDDLHSLIESKLVPLLSISNNTVQEIDEHLYLTNVDVNSSKICIDDIIREVLILKSLAKRLNAATKQKKMMHIFRIQKQIAKYNKMVTILRGRYPQDQRVKKIPSINTKCRSKPGTSQKLMDDGFDSVLQDYSESEAQEQEKERSICICRGCYFVREDNLKPLIESFLNNAFDLDFLEGKLHLLNGKNFEKVLQCWTMPCLRKGCNRRISLSTLLNRYQSRNEFEDKKRAIFYNFIKIKYPDVIHFCKNNKCKFSTNAFWSELNIDHASTSSSHIHCRYCNMKHHVHAHSVQCPNIKCAITWCRICNVSPYHISQICQGPRSADMDDATYVEMMKNSRSCPECKRRIEKTEGCDHIQCTCGVDWCYRCLQKLDKSDPYGHRCVPSRVIDGSPSGAYRNNDENDVVDLHQW